MAPPIPTPPIFADGRCLHTKLCGPYVLTELAPGADMDYGAMGIPVGSRPTAMLPMIFDPGMGGGGPVIITVPRDLVVSFPYAGMENVFGHVEAAPAPVQGDSYTVYVLIYYTHTILGEQDDQLPARQQPR